ncbi:hypothetical protein M6B38_265410 [Iris pallida]|uniref:Uncharacterized protein n=1 Tax=Iris pallida TaxID=29817 RepID=A0AAX6IBP0_IRIPA|nr:hypothetical protein M6B38_265410 [Iris pallida]
MGRRTECQIESTLCNISKPTVRPFKILTQSDSTEIIPFYYVGSSLLLAYLLSAVENIILLV